MTTTRNDDRDPLENDRLSTSTPELPPVAPLIPEAPTTVALRGTQADVARAFEVSRTTVSNWVRDGKVLVGPDGLIDLTKAAKRIIATTDPARLRAKVLKQATASHAELHGRIRALEADRDRWKDWCSRSLDIFAGVVGDFFEEVEEAHDNGVLHEWLEARVDELRDPATLDEQSAEFLSAPDGAFDEEPTTTTEN